ncbi:MAG: sigma-70 family RNA polymerase sigma factor [Candidatus Sumerlaeaceae bacterium]
MTELSDELVHTDAVWTDAARDGDQLAFSRLVERYYGSVFAVGYSILWDRESAEDLTQEVFLRVFLNLASLRNSRLFAPWVLRTARNLAFDWRKKQIRASRLVQFVTTESELLAQVKDRRPTPMEQATDNETAVNLRAYISTLPPSQRDVVMLHFGEGLSLSEVARQLSVQPSTVSRQLQRALANLREFTAADMERDLKPPASRKQRVAGAVALIGAAISLPAQAREQLIRQATIPRTSVLSNPLPGGKLMPALGLGAAAVAAVIWFGSGSPATDQIAVTIPGESGRRVQTIQSDIRIKASPASTKTESVLAPPLARDLSRPAQVTSVAAAGAKPNVISSETPVRIHESPASSTPLAATPIILAQSSPQTVTAAAAPVAANSTAKADNAEISGRVTNEQGSPILHVYIAVRWENRENKPQQWHRCNDDGTFRFEAPASRRCALRFVNADYVQTTASATAPAVGLQIVMPTDGASIEGQVIDSDGRPVAGAKLSVSTLESADSVGQELQIHTTSNAPILTPNMPVVNIYSQQPVFSDDTGRFRCEKLHPGHFDVIARLGKQAFGRARTVSVKVASSPDDVWKGYITLAEKATTSGIILTPIQLPGQPQIH